MPQAQVNPNWEERYQQVKEQINIFLDPHKILDSLYQNNLITIEEWHRSLPKIYMLQPFITRMVVNMIKGTLKYTSDDWSTEIWQDMGMDDKVDGVNYEILFHNHLRELGVI